MMICKEHGTKGYEDYVICKNLAGLVTHFKDDTEYEYWREYNQTGQETHYKDNEGLEDWKEYNKQGKLTHFKNNKGLEKVYEKHKCTIKNKEQGAKKIEK